MQAPLQRGTLFDVWSSDPLPAGSAGLAVGMHARSPSRRAPANALTDTPTAMLELLATAAVWRGSDLSAGLTVHRSDSTAADPNAVSESGRTSLGDVRFVPRLRIAGDPSGSGVGLFAPILVPAGTNSFFAERGVRIAPRMAVSYVGPQITFSSNVGYLMHATVSSATASNHGTAGLGAELAVSDTWSAIAEVSGRLFLQRAQSDPDNAVPVEARAGVRFSVAGWVAQFGAGSGLLGQGPEPTWRLLGALGFTPSAETEPRLRQALREDSDGDTIANESDACVNEAEDWNGVTDLDGCPDAASAAEEAERQLSFDDPCPDGVSQGEDCIPGVVSGEPGADAPADEPARSDDPPATEGTGLAADDRIPQRTEIYGQDDRQRPEGGIRYAPGTSGATGSPGSPASPGTTDKPGAEPGRPGTPSRGEKTAVVVPPLEIPEVMQFKRNQMQLEPAQLRLLDEIAKRIKAAPRDVVVIVEGHSDGSGRLDFNRLLSRIRALSVRHELIRRGIHWSRLGVVGHGAARPVADNTNEAGRSQNRRVQFRVIQRRR
jgi:outer membrane protein OmpA-like peptidoglycan-associated protein